MRRLLIVAITVLFFAGVFFARFATNHLACSVCDFNSVLSASTVSFKNYKTDRKKILAAKGEDVFVFAEFEGDFQTIVETTSDEFKIYLANVTANFARENSFNRKSLLLKTVTYPSSNPSYLILYSCKFNKQFF